jgi:phosphoglycerol transferase MdoB-like AlkP superfamily enzyme
VLINLIEMSRGPTAILPLWPESSVPTGQRGNGQNLVFLQLESVNSAAGFGRSTAGGRAYDAVYMPELQRLSGKGVLIPYFWANDVQTIRALATVLCGTVGNLGGPIAFNLGLIRQDCLPATLRKSDYTSLYFSGFSDKQFHNLQQFTDRVGFDKLTGEEILKPGDPIGEWGFEECTFYRRVFETLREQHPNPERMFIYIAVSRHHIPYRTDPGKAAVHNIKNATTDLESYLNSLSEQDACLAIFWDEYSRYAAGSSHLFVFGDHSVTLGLDVPTDHRNLNLTNFLTPLLYIPPDDAERDGQTADAASQVVAGQADLAATSLELLGLGVGANSFANALEGRGAENHEACQVLVHPYGEPAVVVVRNTDKYAYLLEEKTILRWEIVDQVGERPPAVMGADISYEEFLSMYGCERYRRNLAKGSPEAPSE